MLTKRFELKLDESLWEWIRKQAHKKKLSMAEFVRWLLRLKRYEN